MKYNEKKDICKDCQDTGVETDENGVLKDEPCLMCSGDDRSLTTEIINIVFDGHPGPPDHTSGRFVEVENSKGESITIGKWVQDGTWWKLQLTVVLDDNHGNL